MVTPDVELGRTRLLITSALFAAAFVVVAIRLIDVTLLGERNGLSISISTGEVVHKPGRAQIVDRNGVLLATSLKTASLYANPRIIPNAEKAAGMLAGLLPEINERELRAKLAQDKHFVWVRRHMTPQQKYDANRLGIPGLDFRNEEHRVYPAGTMAGHILGHTDIDGRGLMGIERKFNRDLKSRRTPLQLSLDLRVQHTVLQELKNAMLHFSAVGAAGIVMDVNSGEIIAMVSLPEFDPNHPDTKNDEAQFNRATLGVYEMGSTFKIFTTAMALDSGKVTLQSGYDATRPIRVSRYVIRDFHAKRRWLSVPEIFMYSSNIGSVKMARQVGLTAQRSFLRKLGMLQPASLELDEIGTPLVPRPWRDINAMTISYGLGLAISPVQLVAGVAAMVNGGVLYKPTLLKHTQNRALIGSRVIKTRTSEQIRRLLRLVVTQGTGKKAQAPGYLVGGKTGTANKVVGRKYKSKAVISSFISAFPMNAPRYVVFAMLDEPSGTAQTHGYTTGGWVAAPIVGKVIARIGPLLRVKPIDEAAPSVRRMMSIDVVTKQTGKPRLASF